MLEYPSMVSFIETYNEFRSEWISLGEVIPGQSGALSHNPGKDIREAIVFRCARDDSKTTIYKSPVGIDDDINPHLILQQMGEDLEILEELTIGDKPYELDVIPDKSDVVRKFRFSHK